MDRLRSTFKRSRTPTGAEMKTQTSLEVPKQVRSVSFDEIKLGCAKRDDDARKERTSAGGGYALAASSLRVPAGGGSGQRSRSFDSSAAAASTGAATGDRDDPGVYLEVPSSKHQLFHRRRSSGEKAPAAAACVHCAYLEELSKMNRSSSGDENQSQRSFTSTSASEDMEDEDDRGCQITVTVEADLHDDLVAAAVRLSIADGIPALPPPPESADTCGKSPLTLELTPPDEYLQGNRRRSITSPKLERQEAFAVSDAADPAAVRDLFLTVPDLKRDRAASMDSCFINKPTPAGKPEEVVPVSPTQLLLDPNCGQPACNNNIRSRSVDIVLPTDQQARYKALSTNNQTSSPPSAVPAHRVPPDKGATGTDGNDKLLKIVPDWTEEAANDDHLWSVTSHNVDFCYIGESECSWKIGFFEDENKYSVIPSNWTFSTSTGDFCRWPSKQRVTALMIIKADEPNVDWSSFPVNIIGESYDSYDRAIQKEREIFLSESERSLGRGKRKRKELKNNNEDTDSVETAEIILLRNIYSYIKRLDGRMDRIEKYLVDSSTSPANKQSLDDSFSIFPISDFQNIINIDEKIRNDEQFEKKMKHGVRLKCSGCRIIVHSECLGNLPEAAKCKSSFKDDGVRQYREHKTVKHHWMHRRTQKDKCSQCGKAFQSVLSFSSKEIIALTCSWCKLSVHNKTTCFNDTKMNEPCSLGKHSNIIVPPSWIVKLPRKGNFKSSIRSPKKRSSKKKTKDKPDKEDKLFVIKPIPTVNVKPVIIFINPKSGGNQGVKLLQKFQWHLNPRQVFDLSRGGPRMGLELYKKVPNLRVLACGGDGTVGWVLSILDQIANAVSFPVGVLPLGTGNDLARALGWGGGYMDEPVSKILTNLEESETIRLDRWNLDVVPNEQVKGTDHAGKDNLPLNVVNNYFSLGVDAQIALEFHEAREANPEKFSSRMYNKLFYGVRGGIELLDRKWKGLSDHMTLECDGKDLTQRIKDLKVHAILFLNIPSYGGGTRPWNKSAGNNSTDDGLIEVIGLTIMQITRLQTGGTGTPLCQCKTARITTSIPVPMQVDGEACRLKPSVITLGFFNQATMMAKRRKGRQTPTRETTIDKHRVSVQRLRLQDYEQHHCDKELLIQSSINMGEIEVEPVADLETVRNLVDKLELNNSPSKDHVGNVMPKLSPDWCFVDCCTAERFFRIDRAQESLHYLIDITHDQLFVLDDPHRPPSAEEDVAVVLKAKEPAGDQGAQDTTTSMRVKSEISRLESIKTKSTVKCPQDEGQTNGTNHSTRASEVYNRLFDLQSNEDHHYGQVRTSDKIIEAAKTGNLNMLRNLFEMGYSLMSINKDGQTALHVASQRGDSNLVRYILANAPSNIVSVKDNLEGQTALHVAVQNGERKICYLLVSAGAPLLAVDKQDRTAQQIAEQTRDYDLAKYLECQAQFVSFADQTETSV